MNKNNFKTESVAEFLARGGNVTKVALNKSAYKNSKKAKVVDIRDIDMKMLPTALRIKYGVK